MQTDSNIHQESPWAFYTKLWPYKSAIFIAALPWLVFAVIARLLVRYFSEPEAMNPDYLYTITNGLHFQEKAALFAGTSDGLQILPLAWFGHAIFVFVLGLFATDFLRIISGVQQEISLKKYVLLPTLFTVVSFTLMGSVWGLYALHNTATNKQQGTYINEMFKSPDGKTFVMNTHKPDEKTTSDLSQNNAKELPPVLDRIDRMTSGKPIAGIVIHDEADSAIKTLATSLNIIIFSLLFIFSPRLIQLALGHEQTNDIRLSLSYNNVIEYLKRLLFPLIPLLIIFPPLALLCERLRDVIPPYLAVTIWAFLFSLKWFLYIALACHVAWQMSHPSTTNEDTLSTF